MSKGLFHIKPSTLKAKVIISRSSFLNQTIDDSGALSTIIWKQSNAELLDMTCLDGDFRLATVSGLAQDLLKDAGDIAVTDEAGGSFRERFMHPDNEYSVRIELIENSAKNFPLQGLFKIGKYKIATKYEVEDAIR